MTIVQLLIVDNAIFIEELGFDYQMSKPKDVFGV